jgi:small subunit ribosomal protein S20
VKRVRAAVESKDPKAAAEALKTAVKSIDRAASKGVMHPKAASRAVSRLSASVHKLAAAK